MILKQYMLLFYIYVNFMLLKNSPEVVLNQSDFKGRKSTNDNLIVSKRRAITLKHDSSAYYRYKTTLNVIHPIKLFCNSLLSSSVSIVFIIGFIKLCILFHELPYGWDFYEKKCGGSKDSETRSV
jgi:hypothetical protein